MEQIQAAALAALRQLSRVGLEVGGLLLGEHTTEQRGEQVANSIRILSWRPFLCEHGRGPAFLLTDKDHAELESLLLSLKEESSSTGSYPLGWFVSHTKGAAAMTDSDLEIYQRFFPESWQTTLVLSPGRDGTVQASFFIRDFEGQIRPASQLVFSTSPAHASQADPGRPRPPALFRMRQSIRSPHDPAPSKPALTEPAIGKLTPKQNLVSSVDAARRALFDRRGWIWLVPALLALIVLGTIVERNAGWRKRASTNTFGFRASEVGGLLRIEWDRNSETIRQAARASVEIKDGNATVPIALDAYRLREGFADYYRKSGDLVMRMTVYPASGAPVQEFTRFVGDPTPLRISPAEATALRSEVQQLRQRNRQLEQTIRNLEQHNQVKKTRSRRRR